MQKLNNRAILEEQKSKIKTQLLDKQAYLAALNLRREQENITEEIAIQNVMKQTGVSREVAAAQIQAAAQIKKAALDAEIQKTQQEITGLKLKDAETTVQLAQNAGGIVSIFGNLLSILTPIIGLMQIINMLQLAYNKSAEKGTQIEKKNFLQKLKSIPVMISKAYLACVDQLGPVAGTIAFAAIAAVIAGLGIAAGVGIAKGIQGTSESGSQKTADDINKLSNEIYKLENKARALDTITKSYDDLDKKLIKTNEDQEEMNNLFDQAADKLDEEQKNAYKALQTNKDRLRYLKAIQQQSEEQADALRRQQINLISNASLGKKNALLDENTTDSNILTAQAAIYANNNNELYKYIDSLTEAKAGVEDLAEALLSELTPAQALAFAEQPELISKLVDSLNSLSTTYTSLSYSSVKGTAAEVLTSDDYSVVDKVNAYKDAIASLDSEMAKILETTYSDIAVFAEFDTTVLDFINKKNFTTDGINSVGKAIQELGYDTTQSTQMIQLLFAAINSGSNIQDAIYNTFGRGLSDTDYNNILKAYSDAIGTGVLNMGQNIQSLKNTINSFYETAMK